MKCRQPWGLAKQERENLMIKPLRVLIVEDSEDDTELSLVELERGGYQPTYRRVDTAAAMREALEADKTWDLIVADYIMPRFSALEALGIVKEWELDVPFIIVSAKISEGQAIAMMRSGANDFLQKDKLARLLPIVDRELKEARIRKENRIIREKLTFLAFYDDLTGLPNRSFFLERLKHRIEQSDREKGGLFAVLSVNLERFRNIKQSMGHSLSEQLTLATARRLQKCLDEADIVARVSEEDFAILLADLETAEEVRIKADLIHQTLATPFKLNGTVVFSNANIGIALNRAIDRSAEEMLQAADTAMYRAMENLGKRTAVFSAKMYHSSLERIQLETDLQQAIASKKLHLKYQPIVSMASGKIVSLEALLRWNHPQRGLVAPDKFIPISEQSGLIIPLGQWVLGEACRRLLIWQRQFPRHLDLNISVNLSGVQLLQPNLVEKLDELIFVLGIKAENLKLEITETVLMENQSKSIQILKKLKDKGIKLYIDDFGIGYSSLSYLHNLPIDALKIDRSFISHEFEQKNLGIVKTIVNMAHCLNLEVVAEGIETEEQRSILEDLGCQYGQGFLFSRPLDVQAMTNLIEIGLT
jgi:diguanylate cyclase (GGDEF)-like protein